MAHYYSSSAILAAIRFYLLFSLFVVMVSAQVLSPFFYARTCPNALTTIKSAVDSAVSSEPRMGASLLRLHFHDCFVQDDTTNFIGEKTAFPNNNSLRRFDVIDTIKSQLENMCPSVVLCVDIVTVAARDSVVALGGPSWQLLLGRRDSTTANLSAANSDVPSPALNLSGLLTLVVTTILTMLTSRNLSRKKGLLHSDQQLFNGGSTDFQVGAYSSDLGSFQINFANAMVKIP
ncbi:cationic peroxidase 1 [Quercus suber]|uniref:peroxidase n=1 Tax=Quercus suber TaxID=58331 RepID=A0AAW0L4G1_QUESU